MPVSVVQDGPWWNPLTPVLRSAATAGGATLRVLARVAILASLLTGCYWAVVTFGDQPSLSSDLGGFPSGPLTLWLIAFAVVAELLGRRLVRRRRKTVLFLRRFGYDDATRAILAATESVGRTWRVVTLDDSSIQPVEAAPRLRRTFTGVIRSAAVVDRGRRRAGTGLRWLYTLTVLAGLVFIWQSGASGDEMLGWLESGLPAIISFIETWFVRVLTVVVVLAVLWVLAVLAMRLVRTGSRSLDTAMEYRYLVVRGAPDIEETCQRLDSRERAVFNPRLMVVKVDSAVWQATVSRLADVSDAMLFDVSRPSDNLVWEMETLLEEYADCCVFIGHLDTLRRYLDRVVGLSQHDGLGVEPVTGSLDSPVARVDQLLDGRTVVGYRSDAQGLRRFRRALRAELEALPGRPEVSWTAPTPGRHSAGDAPPGR